MRPIERNEVLPIGEYEMIRAQFRARVISEKKPRRFQLCEILSGVFENRDSALLQIQEMLRTERITSEPAILHEIETYNDLVPGEGQLSMTVFVEIVDKEERDKKLVELAGLETCFGLEVDGAFCPAVHKPSPGAVTTKTTAVHYLKVTLPEEARRAILDKKAKVAVVVKHPRLDARADLGPATIAKLSEDLSS